MNVNSHLSRFVEVAEEFCLLIENHAEYELREFLNRIREILPRLYLRALDLPDIAIGSDELDREITHEEWAQLFSQLQQLLGASDYYWLVYDPVEFSPPVAGSLSDDLADIWRDLKNGLMHWPDATASIQREIVWEWKFHFHGHWSSHVVDALRAINSLIETHCVGRDGDDKII